MKLISILCVAIMLSAIVGCKSFYENSGSRTVVGDVSAPVELSDSSDAVTCKLLYSLTGASVWTAKDSNVTIGYANAYTNTYFGCVDKTGVQKLEVKIEPVEKADDSE